MRLCDGLQHQRGTAAAFHLKVPFLASSSREQQSRQQSKEGQHPSIPARIKPSSLSKRIARTFPGPEGRYRRNEKQKASANFIIIVGLGNTLFWSNLLPTGYNAHCFFLFRYGGVRQCLCGTVAFNGPIVHPRMMNGYGAIVEL